MMQIVDNDEIHLALYIKHCEMRSSRGIVEDPYSNINISGILSNGDMTKFTLQSVRD